jgi:NAD(P)H-hydrate epimerase
MQPIPSGVYSTEQVRELDRRAIERCDLPGYELMTRAGHATLNALRRHWPGTRSLLVCCGPGNNGGDGYVLARIARAQGLATQVVSLVDPARLGGDARRAHDDFVAAGGTTQPFAPGSLAAGDVIVDALFGIGLARAVDGPVAACIDAVNASGRPVVAVDIPSGLQADTGQVLGHAVRAALTVTFIGRKLGCYVGAGPDHCGRIAFDSLEVPQAVYQGLEPLVLRLDESVLAQALPPRARAAHKGSNGHVLVIGGAPGMGGAARLAGEAALRAGAGLVTVAAHPGSLGALALRPELMSRALESARDLDAVLDRATVVALGPGLGQSPWAQEVFDYTLAAGKPLVLDADALNLLARQPQSRAQWVLTPHPGEAARLLGVTVADVQSDRLAAVSQMQSRYGGTVVLKGAGTLVAAANGVPWLCDRGNPGMAVAGMGDVLTGVIAGIAAQCGELALAARAGVYAHADAGDREATRGGERGMTAGDVIAGLRASVNPP